MSESCFQTHEKTLGGHARGNYRDHRKSDMVWATLINGVGDADQGLGLGMILYSTTAVAALHASSSGPLARSLRVCILVYPWLSHFDSGRRAQPLELSQRHLGATMSSMGCT